MTNVVRQTSQSSEVERIAGVSDADARLLSTHDIHTVDDLWRDGSGLAERVESAVEASGVRRELLYGVLIADALGALREKGRARRLFAAAGRSRYELAFVALLLLAVSLMAYRGFTARANLASRVEVKAGSKLAALRAIEAGDLTLGRAFPGKGTFSTIEEVVGRYPSDAVAGGKPVTESHLLRKELSDELGRRHLLVLPVKQGTAGQAIKMPATVWLLLPSPDEKISTALIVKDVMLLTLGQEGKRVTATVALTESGLAEMKDYMGRSEALIIQPPTPPPPAR